MPETDLYMPVKTLFENMGYSVKAEVLDADVLAVKDGETVAVELKLSLNLDVIVQAALRQKVADKVYIAVPPAKRAALKKRQNISHVLRRLEIGLITVREDEAKITFEAKEFDRKGAISRSKKTREKMMDEFSLRHGDENVGGTNGKTMTVYRERAILIAALSEKYGEIKMADIPYLSGNPRAKSIIESNYYGWFSKNGKSYTITDKCRKELKSYAKLKKTLLSEAEGKKVK